MILGMASESTATAIITLQAAEGRIQLVATMDMSFSSIQAALPLLDLESIETMGSGVKSLLETSLATFLEEEQPPKV